MRKEYKFLEKQCACLAQIGIECTSLIALYSCIAGNADKKTQVGYALREAITYSNYVSWVTLEKVIKSISLSSTICILL